MKTYASLPLKTFIPTDTPHKAIPKTRNKISNDNKQHYKTGGRVNKYTDMAYCKKLLSSFELNKIYCLSYKHRDNLWLNISLQCSH